LFSHGFEKAFHETLFVTLFSKRKKKVSVDMRRCCFFAALSYKEKRGRVWKRERASGVSETANQNKGSGTKRVGWVKVVRKRAFPKEYNYVEHPTMIKLCRTPIGGGEGRERGVAFSRRVRFRKVISEVPRA